MRIRLYVLTYISFIIFSWFGIVFASTLAYVPNMNDNNISVIDTSTNRVIDTITVGAGPAGITTNPLGTRVYVVNHFDNTLSVIDTSNNTVLTHK